MGKRGKVETGIVCVTVLFFLLTVGFFFWQNQEKELSYVISERQAIALPVVEEQEHPESLLPGERININSASPGDLERLPGIGPVRAGDIVAFREQNGKFTSGEDLMQVSGIGEKTYEKLAPYISWEDT